MSSESGLFLKREEHLPTACQSSSLGRCGLGGKVSKAEGRRSRQRPVLPGSTVQRHEVTSSLSEVRLGSASRGVSREHIKDGEID